MLRFNLEVMDSQSLEEESLIVIAGALYGSYSSQISLLYFVTGCWKAGTGFHLQIRCLSHEGCLPYVINKFHLLTMGYL